MCITFDGEKTQLNFAEAALLIQGSACIYSKKVEHKGAKSLPSHIIQSVFLKFVHVLLGGAAAQSCLPDSGEHQREEEKVRGVQCCKAWM